MAEKNDYVNRELSWIEFNYRVLSEARDKSTPLFDRLKFLSITASNLDEFYMVRVASLKDMVHAKYAKKDIAGLTAKEQLDKISEKTHQLVDLQYSTYNRSLVPALKQNGLRIVMEHEDLTEDEAAFADEYFHKNVYPVLTPMAFDSSRPFPLIRNKTLNIAALLKKKNEKEAELEFAMVQVPSVIPRIVELPEEKDENGETQRVVILLEEIIERNMQSLFLNYDIVASHPFRIMRNADFSLDEEEAVDLLEEIQKQLKKRQWGEAIRLEIESNVDKQLLKILKKELSISSEDIFQISGPLDLTFLMKMYGLDGFDHLKTPKYTPQPVPELMNEDNIFTNIRKGDILLHHPYQSFDPVVNFVRSAARDPEVLAIKQTLYRVSGNSPIIAALAEAADNGKQVSVLVELKARFDEENNIGWSRLLEDAGCQVIYGLDGYKVHSKLCLITRKNGGQVEYITQIGTGNYNEKTSRLYTDLSLMTANVEIGLEASNVFQALSKGEVVEHSEHLLVAPKCLQNKVLAMLDEEIAHARNGEEAYAGFKLNSLTDKKIIDKLIEASEAGVKIDMVVRGICCLIPGVEGKTENIRIISIVGRFLEHSRIYIFGNSKRRKYYIASADFMTRNTVRRVEVAAPVYDERLQNKLQDMFDIMLADNQKARYLDAEGNYHRVINEEAPLNSQEYFYTQAYHEL